ncbi:MAG: response regulator [Magnetococcales bacterium]|nr:response regulator [Magnetococcales bacterium]NGZ07527.1 response regulator [Magnetococcales bacterium]
MDEEITALIVDDNPMERALLSGLLKKLTRWTILPHSCATGEETFRFMEGVDPHLAFVDYRLERESGIDLIRKMKSMGSRAGCILFTGTEGDEALLEAVRVGADDYLRKNELSVESLNRAIHHVLEKSRTARNLEAALAELQKAKAQLEKKVETDAEVLTEARERLDAIASAALDPILILDAEGKVTFWNPAATRVFGHTTEEILGRSVIELLPPSDFATRLKTSFKNFGRTGKGTMIGRVTEFTVKRKNGKSFPVEASSAAIQIRNAWHVVVILRDVTKHRQDKAALLKARDAAERATRLKDQFVSLVAHDLRGPFTSILGFLELIDNDPKNPLTKKQKGYLNWISESSAKMLTLINEILDISRLKTGKIVPEPRFFNARFAGDKALEQIRPMAEQKGIEVINNLPDSFRLYADPGLFGEVLHNLLTNAVKFCNTGDRITLLRPANKPSTLAVLDTGVGIRQKRIPRLFKLEEKTSTVGTAGEHGTGYGLPFSRDLLRAHHGDLTVESKEGIGSIFYAQVPEVTPQALIIDDDTEFRQLLLAFLHHDGVHTQESSNGIGALEILKSHACHLIICDVQMPGMDGFTFLGKVRQDPKNRHIPIILVTGDDTIETRETAFRLGANDFINKPFTPTEFIPRVRRFLG